MSRGHVNWLLKELPALVSQDVLTRESADAVARYYQSQTSRSNLALLIFGVLGVLSMVAGLVLLIAHNWYEFSRTLRVGLSVLPLLIALIVNFWVHYTQKPSASAWVETAALGWCFSIAVSIILVSQTYHIQGDFERFLCVWILAALPILYLTRSVLSGVLMVCVSGWWILYAFFERSQPAYVIWPLLALFLPFIRQVLKADMTVRRRWMLQWCAGIVGTLSLLLAPQFEGYSVLAWPTYCLLLFNAIYLAGCSLENTQSIWWSPLRVLGSGCALIVCFWLTWESAWSNLYPGRLAAPVDVMTAAPVINALIAGALLLVIVGMWIQSFRRQNLPRTGFAYLGIYGLACMAGPLFILQPGMMVLGNLVVLALGLETLIRGIQLRDYKYINWGLGLVALLGIFRFFDMELSLSSRGFFFVGIGLAFMLVNGYVARKKAELNA